MDLETIKTLRFKHISETELMASKQRFALFSQPPPLSIGDDSYDRRKHIPRNEMGKPVTQRPNPCATSLKKGKDNSVYFSKTTFHTIGDLYIDPDRKDRQYELQKKKLITNEAQFKPASGYKMLTTSAYPHESDFTHKEKNYRDETGKVISNPPNPIVGIRGLHESLYSYPKFMPDPYERKREMEKKERLMFHKKLGEKLPFKSTEFGNKAFNDDKQTYGLDRPIQETKNKIGPNLNILKHETPFKPSNPSKSGYNGFLNKFPEYLPDPIRQIKRIEKKTERETFKPNNGGNLSRPTPTITCNPINIRREMASMSYRM